MRLSACLCMLLFSCQQPRGVVSAQPSTLRSHRLEEVRLDGSALDLRAFVAGMVFLFPQESEEWVRSALRAAMTEREAERLSVQLPSTFVDDAMEQFTASVLAQLGPGASLELWSQQRHGHPWKEMEPLYRRQIGTNLLYQIVLRAAAYEHGRVAMYWYLAADQATAEQWVQSLHAGRDPRSLVAESLQAGPEPDGSYPPMSVHLPEPLGEAMSTASVGQVVGPVQLQGDRGWRVGLVREVFPPQSEIPPISALLAELEEHPIHALEARAWFEEMSVRYTAVAELSPFSGPIQAFEPLR